MPLTRRDIGTYVIQIVFVVVGIPTLIVAATLFVLWLYAPPLCDNQTLAEYPSPDGRNKVVVFERDCGASTDFSTQASLLESTEELPSKSGNLFAADTNHGFAPDGPGGGPRLDVHWENARTVVLAHDSRARVFMAETKSAGVLVRHVELR